MAVTQSRKRGQVPERLPGHAAPRTKLGAACGIVVKRPEPTLEVARSLKPRNPNFMSPVHPVFTPSACLRRF